MTEKADFLGIKLTFYGVLAFVLAIFGQTLLCGLLLGFSILAVKDRWLARQVMQAFFLCFVSNVVSLITGVFAVFSVIPFLGALITGFIAFLGGLVSIVVLILAILALLRVAKGQEADLPIAKGLAGKAFLPEA